MLRSVLSAALALAATAAQANGAQEDCAFEGEEYTEGAIVSVDLFDFRDSDAEGQVSTATKLALVCVFDREKGRFNWIEYRSQAAPNVEDQSSE